MMFGEFPDARGLDNDIGGRYIGFRGRNAYRRVSLHHRFHQKAQAFLSQNELRSGQKRTPDGHIAGERKRTGVSSLPKVPASNMVKRFWASLTRGDEFHE
jgi:hypothetical protein